MTQTKKMRVFDWDKNKKSYTPAMAGFRSKLTAGTIVRRNVPEPAAPRSNAGNCHVCGFPVMVSKGQVVLIYVRRTTNHKLGAVTNTKSPSHKACRKAKK